jgi:hypothetical protein
LGFSTFGQTEVESPSIYSQKVDSHATKIYIYKRLTDELEKGWMAWETTHFMERNMVIKASFQSAIDQ